ncbi:MAG: signal peptidase II [Alphaproteobacteria bacterium]|nr:signal peptidase II [Alphaproteobacteria bacterium]MCB9698618.1 signal peptidase II [Alphaproteobacteria bacterium]
MNVLSPRNLVFGSTVLACVAADQVTKRWVVAHLTHNIDEISIVPGWFSIVHAQNTGAAFSTMEGQMALFLVFTVVAVAVVLDMVRRTAADQRFVPFTLGMILAGALGNGIDRLLQGHVTDFLKVYAGHEPLRGWFIERFGTNVWPIFNVADSLLLVGVALFLVYWLVQREGEVEVEADVGEADAPTPG